MKRLINLLAWIFILTGVVISLIVLISIYFDGKIQIGFLDWNYAKKVNDVSGLLAFLFTGAGTFAIFLTLIKQQEQFDEAQKQVVTQQFETTFFNMLYQLFNIKNSINGMIDGKSFAGQEYLNFILLELKKNYQEHLKTTSDISEVLESINQCQVPTCSKITMVKDDLNVVYMDTYNRYHSQLGHFFRYFFNLMKFARDNRENPRFGDADKYVQLIQAQLSNDELGLIFCNSLSDKALNSHNENKIFKWLESYSFLENVDSESLLSRGLHILYPNTKFKFLNNSEKRMKQQL